MKIQFMGTAAAEGAPALFCVCDHCRYARANGGREIRSRAGSIVDGRLKLDFGPDSFKQMLDCGVDYTNLRAVLITHSHDDHLLPTDLAYRREGFGHFAPDDVPLTVYGNEAVGEALRPHLNPRLRFERIRPFLAGRKLDLISMDCTNGVWDCDYYGHMGVNDNLRMREKLLANGAANAHTIFVSNHFSHNGLAPYEELCRRLPGFHVSYDGMTLTTKGEEA